MLVVTVFALNPGETLMQVAAIKMTIDNLEEDKVAQSVWHLGMPVKDMDKVLCQPR